MPQGPLVDGRPDVVTFDCYGTLIDWETGIKNAFLKALADGGPSGVEASKIFELYEEEERRIEKQQPFLPYREVLSQSVLGVAEIVGWELSKQQSHFLAKDLPNWKPYPDTNPALKRLATRYELGILSNVDNDLLAGTLKHFTVQFHLIVTAEQVRSYKPGPAHFEQVLRIIGKDRTWLHVAASLYHDIEPAQKLGVRTIWVNRGGSAIGHEDAKRAVKQVKGLAMLADQLEV